MAKKAKNEKVGEVAEKLAAIVTKAGADTADLARPINSLARAVVRNLGKSERAERKVERAKAKKAKLAAAIEKLQKKLTDLE